MYSILISTIFNDLIMQWTFAQFDSLYFNLKVLICLLYLKYFVYVAFSKFFQYIDNCPSTIFLIQIAHRNNCCSIISKYPKRRNSLLWFVAWEMKYVKGLCWYLTHDCISSQPQFRIYQSDPPTHSHKLVLLTFLSLSLFLSRSSTTHISFLCKTSILDLAPDTSRGTYISMEIRCVKLNEIVILNRFSNPPMFRKNGRWWLTVCGFPYTILKV